MTTAVSICSNACSDSGATRLAASTRRISRARTSSVPAWRPTCGRPCAAGSWAHVWNARSSARSCPRCHAAAVRLRQPLPAPGRLAAERRGRLSERGTIYASRALSPFRPGRAAHALRGDNDNPDTYDSLLVDALELAMAAALAYPVTKSTSLATSSRPPPGSRCATPAASPRTTRPTPWAISR